MEQANPDPSHENGHSSRSQQTGNGNADAGAGATHLGGQKLDSDVKEALEASQIGREAPTSKVGYGGCGGEFCESPSLARSGKEGDGADEGGVQGSGYAYGQRIDKGSGHGSEVRGGVAHQGLPNGAASGAGVGSGQHSSTDIANKESNGGEGLDAEHHEKKGLKQKLKEVLPGHKRNAPDRSSENEELGSELGVGPEVGDPGKPHLIAKLKEKLTPGRHKYTDEMDTDIW